MQELEVRHGRHRRHAPGATGPRRPIGLQRRAGQNSVREADPRRRGHGREDRGLHRATAREAEGGLQGLQGCLPHQASGHARRLGPWGRDARRHPRARRLAACAASGRAPGPGASAGTGFGTGAAERARAPAERHGAREDVLQRHDAPRSQHPRPSSKPLDPGSLLLSLSPSLQLSLLLNL